MPHEAWGHINHSLFMDAAKRNINPGRASASYVSTPDVSSFSESSAQEESADASTAGSANINGTSAHSKSADQGSAASSFNTAGKGSAGQGTKGSRAVPSEMQTLKGLLKEDRITGDISSMSQTLLNSTAKISPPQAESVESLVQSSGHCLSDTNSQISGTSKSMVGGQEQDLNSDDSSSYDFLALLAGS